MSAAEDVLKCIRERIPFRVNKREYWFPSDAGKWSSFHHESVSSERAKALVLTNLRDEDIIHPMPESKRMPKARKWWQLWL